MASLVVLLFFFALLLVVIYGNEEERFTSVIIGLLFFPHIVAFRNSPYISPHTLLLYIGLMVECFNDPSTFRKSLLTLPIKFPLFFFGVMCILTAISTKGSTLKNIYDMFRYAFDIYGFFLLGYNISLKANFENIREKLAVPVIIFCLLGILEVALSANYPYKIICSAFPIYEGKYDLNSAIYLSQSWRTRICITTHHPNTLSPILLTLLFFFFPKKEKEPYAIKQLLAISLILTNIYLCGSRTGMFCAAFFIALYYLKKFPFWSKFFIIICSITLIAYGATSIVQFFNSGNGSSLNLRYQQLLFSANQFLQSPITGNGVFYMSENIFETDEYGDRIVDNSIGSLESFLFKILIEFGLIGLIAQIFLIVTICLYFYLNRKKLPGTTGLYISMSFYLFLFLAGDAAGDMRVAFSFIGFCLGQIYLEKEGSLSKESKRSEEKQSL